MEKRKYQNTDNSISLLGFGCMRLPLQSEKYEDIDKKQAQEMIDYAYENGVNYFDTAYPYHNGCSETFIGQALARYPRESFYLATKMPIWLINEPQDVEKIFEEQLRKCQVDYFDFYLLHNLSEERLAIEKRHRIYDHLNEKKRQGQIKYLGFSFHDSPEVLERIINSYEWDFVQIQLNYMDWEMQQAQKQYELITNKNIPVVVMEPVRGGALAKLSPEAIKIFKDAAPDAGPASWAMRYAASLPNVLTVLSGMSDLQQVKDNVKTLTNFQALTADDYKTVEKALQAYLLSGAIPCTACRYCMDCPNGVYIPQVFDLYNRYCTDGNPDYFAFGYQMIGKEHQAHKCTECEQCADLCPQSLPISEWMVKITKFAESLAEAQ